MVEFYANNANDPGDYLIGEEFDLTNHVGFRRMDNPSLGRQLGQLLELQRRATSTSTTPRASATTSSTCWPRASARRPSAAWPTTSTTCNGSTVTGIGRDAAGKIWYRALTVYMTSSTNYSGARTASLNAARDLYGAGSTQYNAVAAAWSAVSVN